MKTIIIISPCISTVKFQTHMQSEFHFKGFFAGHKLKRLIIKSKKTFIVGEEYILYVEIQKIIAMTLYGKAMKSKSLNSLTMDL